MERWILPTISETLAQRESSSFDCHSQQVEQTAGLADGDVEVYSKHLPKERSQPRAKAEREWSSAIASLSELLLDITPNSLTLADGVTQGLVLAGPVPVLSHKLLSSLHSAIFTTDWLKLKARPCQLPPATAKSATDLALAVELESDASSMVPLLAGDPLATEQFCLVLTHKFSLVMVLGTDIDGLSAFMFSFEPEVVEQVWRSLRARVELSSSHTISQLDSLVEKYYPVVPDYRTVMQFSRLLLKHLPETSGEGVAGYSKAGVVGKEKLLTTHHSPRPDLELLQAFAHEVRTPLTTIRTLIRLLMKRRDLALDVLKRLEIIEHECREQIDRMELMFKAAELETSATKNTSNYLIATSLEHVLQQSIPRWQQSAKRRNLTLDVVLPQQMPTVISHPSMLDQVLTGVIENFTRSLPSGSHIQVQVIPAGDQLKLQLFSQSDAGDSDTAEGFVVPPIRKSLGQLLTFQPETGNISLNLTATKHLFQAIGGKMIVRQRPSQGEVLTIFLPLEVSRQDLQHQHR